MLRQAMIEAGISACIIPGTDPHASEYIADYWKMRDYISGFDGSAGTLAFTLDAAGLWTDSRYFLQGSEQLKGTGIDLMKVGVAETPEMISWICKALKPGERVGVDSQLFSVNAFAAMKGEFSANGNQLVAVDLSSMVWSERPALPNNQMYVFDSAYAGKTASEKIELLRIEMRKSNATHMVISALDDIAWLYNIRGNDVNFNPVVLAYSLVSLTDAVLFIDEVKLNDDSKAYLKGQNVATLPYLEIYNALKGVSPKSTVIVDGAKLNQSLFEALPVLCVKQNQMSPVFKLKSVKNEVEVAGIRKAMIKDGVALVRFFKWLEGSVMTEELSEVSIAKKLYNFRSEQENFVGESFDTIAGYKAHGAIVHYRATELSDYKLKPEGLLLLDSGGQYLDGTTDITRTVSLGKPSKEEMSDFTLVLKGHIALSKAIFPHGTRGSQLDVLARKALWDMGLNYGHGTGHGVGHFLNVHEGPQNIRMDENPAILLPGQILSNEPGMYRANQYGIRIENLIHVVPAVKTEFGQFYEFETLTLFPIDSNLIEVMLLNEEELQWIDDYHHTVYLTLAPHLNTDEQNWLKEKCKPISE